MVNRTVATATSTVLLASLVCFAVPASAQPAEEDASEEARALFEQGIEYAGEERWGEALEYFRRSRQLVDRPSTAFNMAVALLRLGRPTEALSTLDDYLRMSDPEAEAERRAEARRLLELALAQTARLTLSVEPPHAEVRVDGELFGGEGTVRELRLDPGTHSVRVRASGYEPETFDVSLLDGEQARRQVQLRATGPTGPATLSVTSTVAAGRIFVDGEEVGQGLWTGELEPGRHRIEVRAPDYEPFRRVVTAEAGERLGLEAALEPERTLFEEPFFWIVTGAVVVAAGVTIGIVAASGTEPPYRGNSGVVLEGLRF